MFIFIPTISRHFQLKTPRLLERAMSVLYSSEHKTLPSQLPVSQWLKIIDLWTRRYIELCSDPRRQYVSIFENTGEAVGVTMPHPHGQIYGFPFIPPRVQREREAVEAFRARTGGCLYCKVLADDKLWPANRNQCRIRRVRTCFRALSL